MKWKIQSEKEKQNFSSTKKLEDFLNINNMI
jgi:hypothetical protein